MANFSDKADEVVGRAKQAAGDLTDNDELRAEGTEDKARAQLKQGVDAAVDKVEDVAATASAKAEDVKQDVSDGVEKAAEQVSDLADKASAQASDLANKASEAAQDLDRDDKRVLVVAAIAGITLTLLVRKIRNDKRADRLTVGKRAAKKSAKRASKRAAKTGLVRALSS